MDGNPVNSSDMYHIEDEYGMMRFGPFPRSQLVRQFEKFSTNSVLKVILNGCSVVMNREELEMFAGDQDEPQTTQEERTTYVDYPSFECVLSAVTSGFSIQQGEEVLKTIFEAKTRKLRRELWEATGRIGQLEEEKRKMKNLVEHREKMDILDVSTAKTRDSEEKEEKEEDENMKRDLIEDQPQTKEMEEMRRQIEEMKKQKKEDDETMKIIEERNMELQKERVLISEGIEQLRWKWYPHLKGKKKLGITVSQVLGWFTEALIDATKKQENYQKLKKELDGVRKEKGIQKTDETASDTEKKMGVTKSTQTVREPLNEEIQRLKKTIEGLEKEKINDQLTIRTLRECRHSLFLGERKELQTSVDQLLNRLRKKQKKWMRETIEGRTQSIIKSFCHHFDEKMVEIKRLGKKNRELEIRCSKRFEEKRIPESGRIAILEADHQLTQTRKLDDNQNKEKHVCEETAMGTVMDDKLAVALFDTIKGRLSTVVNELPSKSPAISSQANPIPIDGASSPFPIPTLSAAPKVGEKRRGDESPMMTTRSMWKKQTWRK